MTIAHIFDGELGFDVRTKLNSLIDMSNDGGRLALAADTHYYVDNTTGSDSNDGAIGTPWATLQHVADHLAENIDFNNKTVTIHVADSATTYPGVAFRPLIGGGDLVFLGNNYTLGNVKIGNSPEVAAVFSSMGLGGTLFWISGFEFVQTNGAALDFDGTDRGTCLLGEPTFLQPSCNKFSSCQNNGYVLIGNIFDNSIGASVIDGTALNAHTPRAFYGCFNATTYGAYLNCPNFTVTGTVTFSRGFVAVFAGFASFAGAFPVSGTVHGPKFEVGAAGTIFVDSITQFPGDIPGNNYGGTISINSTGNCYVGPWPTAKSLQTPTTGFSITIADTIGALILKPAGTLATGAITLPANPIDQQRLTINSTATVTALTISPNAGQSVLGNPATIAAGTAITAIYNYSDTTWYMASSPAGGGGGGMAIGGTITGATAGRVLFAGAGGILDDDSTFTWNDSLKDLAIGGAYYVNAARALYVVPHATENNWFEGNAGNQTVTGYGNFGTGDLALSSLTTGYNNVAFGTNALQKVTSGYQNFAMGSNALRQTLTDSNNVAMGYNAMTLLGNAGAGAGGNINNLAFGFAALALAEQASNNVCIGFGALSNVYTPATALNNTIIGGSAGGNIGVGAASPVTGNTMIGYKAGYNLTGAPINNVFIGGYQGPAATISYNIAISEGAGQFALLDWNITTSFIWTMNYCPSLGAPTGLHIYNYQDAMTSTANYERAVLDWRTSNVFTIGTQAGGTGVLRPVNIIGSALTFNGSPIGGGGMSIGGAITGGTAGRVLFAGVGGVLDDDSTFTWNDSLKDLAIGGAYYVSAARALYVVPHVTENNWFEGNAGNQTMTGYGNFGTGDLALSSLTTGSDNVAVGTRAGRLLTTGVQNFALGSFSLQSVTSDNSNTAIGTYTLTNLGTGGAGGGSNQWNVAIGFGAMNQVAEATSNIAIGFASMSNIVAPTAAQRNVIIGNQAGGNLGISSSGGTVLENTLIGPNAGVNLNVTSSRNTWIGGYQGPATALDYRIVLSTGNGSFSMLEYNLATIGAWSLHTDPNIGYAASLHIYNAQTAIGNPGSNYERAILEWRNPVNTFRLGMEASGTGVKRMLCIDGYTKAGAPAAGDLPANCFAVIDDTSAGQTWLVFNKAGAIRKVQLT